MALQLGQALGFLGEFPFAGRKVDPANPFLRVIVIPSGSAGHVARYAIEDQSTVTILAIRHPREDDYQ